ncbi:MAG: NADH-quinone oxidoreductase subunit NuoN [Actinobacteria bacterium]|nr:NADH-quinone oxidoreductase subunit NuoN [Actinomycetota bacterium]
MTTLLPTAFTVAEINYWAILPVLIVFGGALIGVLVDAFAPRSSRHSIQVALALLTIAASFGALVWKAVDNKGATLDGAMIIDGPALFMQGSVLLLSFLSVLLMAEKFSSAGADAFTPMGAAVPGSPLEAAATRAGWGTSEVFPLALFSVAGMMIFPAAGDLLVMFVALEVLSLPLYLLTGLARRRRLLSQEAALKYFLLGSFSSAFFLFGSALLFGYAGSVKFSALSQAITTAPADVEGLLLPGVLLVLVGLLFKVGAVPFHQWTPDVYQGAPSPITGFMAACTKLAAFGAILRLAYTGIDADRWDWRMGVAAIAALTMIVGSVLSVTQTDIKRLLAYSSVAHAGFILVGVLAFDATGVSGVMFYVLAYGLATIAAFGIVALVREGSAEASHIAQWSGLGKRHPVVAGIFALLLLTFAGIPLTSGFTAKFAAFAPAIAHGGTTLAVLVVIGVLCSLVTAFVYVRVIVLMYFSEAQGEVRALNPSVLTTVGLAVAVILTVALGVFPAPVLDLANQASQFIR